MASFTSEILQCIPVTPDTSVKNFRQAYTVKPVSLAHLLPLKVEVFSTFSNNQPLSKAELSGHFFEKPNPLRPPGSAILQQPFPPTAS